jgi:hypothetical protein
MACRPVIGLTEESGDDFGGPRLGGGHLFDAFQVGGVEQEARFTEAGKRQGK